MKKGLFNEPVGEADKEAKESMKGLQVGSIVLDIVSLCVNQFT